VTNGIEETRRVLLGEVLPLAANLLTNYGVPMYALGFTGSEPIIDALEVKRG
jgi:hypothetical protein